MINAIGNSAAAAVDTARVRANVRVEPASAEAATNAADGTLVAKLANLGPPFDAARVAAIRTEIIGARYRIDADKIAAAMIAIDLPE